MLEEYEELNYQLEKRVGELLDENERLKDLCDKYEEEHRTTFEEWKKTINIINDLEEWLYDNTDYEEYDRVEKDTFNYVIKKIEQLRSIKK